MIESCVLRVKYNKFMLLPDFRVLKTRAINDIPLQRINRVYTASISRLTGDNSVRTC